ncbi:MAG: universal stress protein [Solirubrobacteraceae bacterium]
MALKTKDRRRSGARHDAPPSRARPVVLATLSVRVDPSAERMAIDSAIEAGVPLVIANFARLPPYPRALALGGPGAAILPHEEDVDAVRATAARAAALGLHTEHLRVATQRPVRAILEVVTEKDAGLLVFGPDRTLVKPRRLRRAAAELRRDATCLVWCVESDAPGGPHAPPSG